MSERLAEALLVQCRSERIEPPGPTRIDRLIGPPRSAFEARFCVRLVPGLVLPEARMRVEFLTDEQAAAHGQYNGCRVLRSRLLPDEVNRDS